MFASAEYKARALQTAQREIQRSNERNRCVGIVGPSFRQTGVTAANSAFEGMINNFRQNPFPNPDWLSDQGYKDDVKYCVRAVLHSDDCPEFAGRDGQADGYKNNNTGHTPSWSNKELPLGAVVVYTMGFVPCPAPSYRGNDAKKLRVVRNCKIIR